MKRCLGARVSQPLRSPTGIAATIKDRVDVDRGRLDQVVEGEWKPFDQYPVEAIHLQVDPGIGGKKTNISLDGILKAIAQTSVHPWPCPSSGTWPDPAAPARVDCGARRGAKQERSTVLASWTAPPRAVPWPGVFRRASSGRGAAQRSSAALSQLDVSQTLGGSIRPACVSAESVTALFPR